MKIECALKFLVLDHIFKARFIIILLDIKSSNRIHFKDYFLILDNEVIFFFPKESNQNKRHSPFHDAAELNLLLTASQALCS